MAGLVFAGVATWDTVAQLPHLPDPDGRVVAEAMSAAGGGPAATAAVTAARLDQPAARFDRPAALVAAVGADREAELITDGLRAEGVDTAEVRTEPDGVSGACVVLVDRGQGSRAICVRPGPPLTIEPGSPAARRITRADWLHVDHAGLPAVLPLLSALPLASRPTVSYDAGNLTPHRCPPEVDVYVPTLATLRDLYADTDPAIPRHPEDAREPGTPRRGPARAPSHPGDATTRGTAGDPPGARPETASHPGSRGTAGPSADPRRETASRPGGTTAAWPAICTHLLDAAHRDGAHTVVATDGPNGAVASGPDGVFAVPGHTGIEIRSTLGAGDVFHGALVAALASHQPLPGALAYANAAAALSCRGLDGRSGIPSDDEVRALAGAVPAVRVEGDS